MDCPNSSVKFGSHTVQTDVVYHPEKRRGKREEEEAFALLVSSRLKVLVD
jgi:hypothetical protein